MIIPRGYLESQRDRLLSVPDSLDLRVRQLAQQLTQGKNSELEKVRAVLAHFDSGFTYSLDPLEGEHEDPLVHSCSRLKKVIVSFMLEPSRSYWTLGSSSSNYEWLLRRSL